MSWMLFDARGNVVVKSLKALRQEVPMINDRIAMIDDPKRMSLT